MIGRQADVREAAEQDFSKIWDIYRKVVDEGIYTPSVRGQVSPDKCESPGLSEDSEAGSMTLLCEVDSKVVGYASIEETIWEQSRHVCELGIAILPEFRGMGVGSALLDSLINFAFKKGYEKITLSVFHTNKNAIGLYRKFGFKKVGEKKRQFNLKGQYVDEIIMEKFVNSR
jgi:ribosomal protein S18 acetylase RimI-like enzyme